MELLSEILSPIDNLEFICEKHSIPCLGLCGHSPCSNKIKLLCMKCIKSDNTCITREKHELVTISELLIRFFKSENNKKSKEIEKLKVMRKIINNYDKKELANILTQYKSIKDNNLIKEIKLQLFSFINSFIEEFNSINQNKLKELKLKTIASEKRPESINSFLQIKLPEINKEKLDLNKDFNTIIREGFQFTSPEKYAKDMKFLSNIDNVNIISNQINHKIYLNKVCSNLSNINDQRQKFEQKIDSILSELETEFDKKMEEIETSLFPQKEIPSLYTTIPISFIKFSSPPEKLQFKTDICDTAHRHNSIDKLFCTFTSFSNEPLIIWSTPNYNLEIYNINKGKIINMIKYAHVSVIYSCRHYPDKSNKIDYVITSSADKSVKVWNIISLECVVNITNAHINISIYSVCILFEENTNKKYIITSSLNEFIKVWDFKGLMLYKFGQNDENHYFIDTYYDNKTKKYFLINCNFNDVKSYYFENGELYQRYKGKPQSWHMSAIVYEYQQQNILVESDGYGFIRMWDFHNANLIKSIYTNNCINFKGICLWNEKYLFVGSSDHQIRLIDLKEGKYIQNFKEHIGPVCTLEKIKCDKYGECLLSLGLDGKIKMWNIAK